MTCTGCGAMGRQERCEGQCSEHKLMLVGAADYDELRDAAAATRARADRLAVALQDFADAEPQPVDPPDALAKLQERVRSTLHDAGPEHAGVRSGSPGVVTGWWCAQCGNVDMPQPCRDLCDWHPIDWVNLSVYEHERNVAASNSHNADVLRRFLVRIAAITPRPGQEQRNWTALRSQARTLLQSIVPPT